MLRRAEENLRPPAVAGSELEKLTGIVTKWGMEAGFLGLEDRLEPRLAALVREAAGRLFGSFEAEFGRLRSALDAVESEWDQAAHRVAFYRSRFGAPEAGVGWMSRLRSWIWDFREYRAARAKCGRREPILRRTREEFAASERKMREAQEWCELGIQSLRAHYEFEKARAASLRPEKDMNYDTREARHFVVRRAN